MPKFLKAVLIFSIIGLLVSCSDGLTDLQYLEKAKELLAEKKFEEASIELKNALQKNPKNPQVRMQLGELYLELNELPPAEKEFLRAAEFGIDINTVLPFKGKTLLYQGKYLEVLDLSVEGIDDKTKAEIIAMKGLSHIYLGSFGDAEKMVDQAIALNSQSVFPIFAKASLLASQKKYDESRKQLDSLLAIDETFSRAWSLLGDIEAANKRMGQAVDAYTKAITHQINNRSDMLKRTSMLINMKEYDKAQEDIDRLKLVIPQQSEFNYLQGLLHMHNKKLREAEAAFELALVNEQRNPLALFYAGLTSHSLGETERAENYARKYLSRFPGYSSARKLLATILLEKKAYKEVEELVRPVVEQIDGDVAAMDLLASALINQGKTDEAIEILAKIVQINPESSSAKLKLGTGLMISGEYAAGEEYLLKATKMDKSDKKGAILLISNYIGQKQFEKAVQIANEYHAKHPNEAESYSVLGRTHLLAGNNQAAEENYKRALEMVPGDPTASLNLAELAIREKDYPKARSYYHNALEKNENHLDILLNLASLDTLEGKPDSMVKNLQKALEFHPGAVMPRLILARHFYFQGKREQLFTLVGDFEHSKNTTTPVLELVSIAQLARGDFKKAKNTLEKILQRLPDSAEAHHLLAKAYAGINDTKAMRAQLEKTIQLRPDHLLARVVLTDYLLRVGEKELAAEHLAVLRDRTPDHPTVKKLEIESAMSMGDVDTALKIAESEYEKTPSMRSMLTLSEIKWSMNDHGGSIQLLNRWIKDHPEEIAPRISLADNYLNLGRIDAMISQYKQILEIDEGNLVALNNLAWFLRERDPRKALEYARIAHEARPKAVGILDTLAMVLLANNELTEAQRYIRDAVIKDPKNPNYRYHEAMIIAASGDKTEAVGVLEKILDSETKFSKRKEAEVLLKKLQSE